MRNRFVTISAVLAAASAACTASTSVGSLADGGESTADARPPLDARDETTDAVVLHSNADATAAPDATIPTLGGDASTAPNLMLLMAIALPEGNEGSPVAYGSSLSGASWAPMERAGPVVGVDRGGGVVVLPNGRGAMLAYGVDNPGTSSLHASSWLFGWRRLASVGSSLGDTVSAPIPTTGGAYAAHQSGAAGLALLFDELDVQSGSWRVHQPTGVTTSGEGLPQAIIALTGSGDPLVALGNDWILRTGGTWSAPAPLPVPALCARATLVQRTGVDEVVGIFYTGMEADTCPGAREGIQSAVFANGAWSGPTTAEPRTAPRLAIDFTIQGMSAAALPDGRVALAILRAGVQQTVAVGFYDGASWSPFIAVPGVDARAAFSSMALARGTHDATLELVYIANETGSSIKHTRLTDAARWTWSTPITVDDSHQYGFVSMDVGFQ